MGRPATWRTQAKCHPEKLNHAWGLCQMCYKKTRPRRTAAMKAKRSEQDKAYRQRVKESGNVPKSLTPEYKRLARIWCRYKLTEQQLEEMYQHYNNACAICKKQVPLVIDHDHETGEVRGLVCDACNILLGVFDNPLRKNAFELYLAKHPVWSIGVKGKS